MSVGPRTASMPWRIRLRWLAALLVLALFGAALLWRFAAQWAPSAETYPMQGISVSGDLGEIDWRTVRTRNVDFAYIRATSGTDRRDPLFAANWAQAREAGLRYGAELVFDPCRRASDQATLFITTVPRDNAALPPVVRVVPGEHCAGAPGRDTILSELNTLLNVIEMHGGKPALIRISKAVEKQYDISSGINRTLWLEGNFFPPDYASHAWVMWTANDRRRVDGIDGPVEWNVVAP